MEKYGLNVIWTARYDYRKGQILASHKHDFYQIIYFIDGTGKFIYDTQKIEFMPGDLFFIKPGTMHGFVHPPHQTLKTLDIKFNILDEDIKTLTYSINLHYQKVPSEIVLLLEKIRSEGMDKKAYYNIFACTYLLQLLHTILRIDAISDRQVTKPSYLSSEHGSDSVADFIEKYMQEHYADSLTIKKISENIGYSESYINKEFKRYYKCTVSKYHKCLRIEKAKELILYSENSLKQIAEDVGFKNIHHFSRVFKEIEGVSPGQWCQKEKLGIRKDVFF